jgi:hypothetical protein
MRRGYQPTPMMGHEHDYLLIHDFFEATVPQNVGKRCAENETFKKFRVNKV